MAVRPFQPPEGWSKLTPKRQSVINAHLVRVVDLIAQSSSFDAFELVLIEKLGEIFDPLTDFTSFQEAVVEVRISESRFLRVLGISEDD